MGFQAEGLEPDAPIVADETGYTSRPSAYEFALMPADALLVMCAVFTEGARTHGRNNWRQGTVEKHVDKAAVHLLAYLAGDRSDAHLSHAAVRTLMALAVDMQNAPADAPARPDD